MKPVLKYIIYFIVLIALGYMIWRFSFMIVWILIAAVISFLGAPLVRFFDSIHIKKLKIPHALNALLALLSITLVFFGFLSIFIPLIVQQAETISNIDVSLLTENLHDPLVWLDEKFHSFGIIPDEQSFRGFMILKAKSLLNTGSLGAIINNFFNVAGTIFVGLFAVLFIAFFFLKDESLFEDGLLIMVPSVHQPVARKVIADSKKLLMRYFVGVLLEILCVMTIITLGLWILGVKNALLIGFFGGLMNVIPYLGPLIGAAIGITLGITATIASGAYSEVVTIFFKLIGVFAVANFIDNNILVPYIYSNSVKAHPLEIFFVIIIGGTLAGIFGMLLAIPVYTVLRVFAKEFFQESRLVQKMTESMNI